MDVVYMLNTSTNPSLLANGGEQEYLRHYHSALLERLKILGDHEAADSYTWELFCHHYDVRFYAILGDNAHGQCFVVKLCGCYRNVSGQNEGRSEYDLIVATYRTDIQYGALMVSG
eukprot:scaffold35982_cov26-Prasinocladus_malaysianus.AAC.1